MKAKIISLLALAGLITTLAACASKEPVVAQEETIPQEQLAQTTPVPETFDNDSKADPNLNASTSPSLGASSSGLGL